MMIQITGSEWMRIAAHQRNAIKEALASRTEATTVAYIDQIEEVTKDIYHNIYGKEA